MCPWKSIKVISFFRHYDRYRYLSKLISVNKAISWNWAEKNISLYFFWPFTLSIEVISKSLEALDLPRGANFSGKGEEIKFIFICIRIDVENAWCLSLLVHRLYVILLFFLNSCSFQKQLDQSGLVQYMQRNGNILV